MAYNINVVHCIKYFMYIVQCTASSQPPLIILSYLPLKLIFMDNLPVVAYNFNNLTEIHMKFLTVKIKDDTHLLSMHG